MSFSAGNNSVICWGDNSLYQTTLPPAITNPVEIKAQGDSTCAVQAGSNNAATALKCWPIGVGDITGSPSDSDNGIPLLTAFASPFAKGGLRGISDGDGVPDAIDALPLDNSKTTNEILRVRVTILLETIKKKNHSKAPRCGALCY